MVRSNVVRGVAAITCLCTALALVLPRMLSAGEPAPQVTNDGLELRDQTKQRLVYVRPGATFSQYTRVAILDCYVEFSKSWLRNYNSSADFSHRTSDSDLNRAKRDLSAQFKKVFTEELTNGGYQVTDTTAPDVLLLRPALLNVQVTAPDRMTPGRSSTFAESAGQMTLYLEIWDAAKNEILARVVDTRADPSRYPQLMGSGTNWAAADSALKLWADELVRKLDVARGKSESH
jgi:Protein of unknown function (DUF3313)